MSSLFREEILEDITVSDFKGATLQIDPASSQHSRSVSPAGQCESKSKCKTSESQSDIEGMSNAFSPVSPELKSFYSGQGLNRSFFKQPPIGSSRRNSWHGEETLDDGIREFFSVRSGALESAIEDCKYLLDPELDGELKGAWLLTEINHWDIEKERVVLLCELSLLIVKYNFIALHHVYSSRIQFASLDLLEHGKVTYPSQSLVPRISGIAGGVVTVIKGVIFNRIASSISKLNSWRSNSLDKGTKEHSTSYNISNNNSFLPVSTISFEPRWRNVQGVRVTWNGNYDLSFTQKWNPFCKDIPYTTFTSHPLYWYSGCEISTYDVTKFCQSLREVLLDYSIRPDTADHACPVVAAEIVIENYVGIASLLHNVSELGFFKMRGKVSF